MGKVKFAGAVGAIVLTAGLGLAPAAMASGGVNSGGVNSGGVSTGGGAGGGGGGSTGVTSAPCAVLTAAGSTVNQSGVTSIRLAGNVKSCSSVSESVYVQIDDVDTGASRTVAPPNTAGSGCYVCESILGAGVSWPYSVNLGATAPGAVHNYQVTLFYRQSLNATPVQMDQQVVTVTAPVAKNSAAA